MKTRDEIEAWLRAEAEQHLRMWPGSQWPDGAHSHLRAAADEIKSLALKLGSVQQDADAFFAECGRLKAERDEARSRLDSIRKYLAGQRATSEHEDEVYQAVSRLADPSAYYEPFVETQKSETTVTAHVHDFKSTGSPFVFRCECGQSSYYGRI